MYCDHCGTKLNETESYCPTCSKPAIVPLMPPARTRVAGHVRLLGILWLAISALRLIPGLFLMALFRHRGTLEFLPPDVPFFVNNIMRLLGVMLLGSAAVGILAGWGLLERQPWARMLSIVLAVVNLIDLPFGTALGVYTLWALLPARSELEYRQIAKAA